MGIVIPEKSYKEKFKESIFVKNAFKESSIVDVLDDADQELKRAKKDNEFGDTISVEDHISSAQGKIHKAEMMTESIDDSEDSAPSGRSYSQDKYDIEYNDELGVVAFNYPEEGQETEFETVEEAAEEIQDAGLSNNSRIVGGWGTAANIFASIIGRENKPDRNSDYRISAYKNKNGQRIIWKIRHPEKLSYLNRFEYARNKGLNFELDYPLDGADCYEYVVEKYLEEDATLKGDHYKISLGDDYILVPKTIDEVVDCLRELSQSANNEPASKDPRNWTEDERDTFYRKYAYLYIKKIQQMLWHKVLLPYKVVKRRADAGSNDLGELVKLF